MFFDFFFFSFNFPWTEAKFAFLFCFSSHRAVPLPRPPWSAPWDLRLSGGLSELEEEEVIFFEIQKPIKKPKNQRLTSANVIHIDCLSRFPRKIAEQESSEHG